MSAGNGRPGDVPEFLPYAMGQSAVGGIQHVLGGGLRLIADHPWLAAAGGPAWNILAAMPQSRQMMGSVGDSALDAGAANQKEALRSRGMAGRFAVNAAGGAPEVAAVIASGPFAPLTAAGIAGADKYGEVRRERGLSPDESLKSAGISAGMNAVIGMIPGFKGLAGPEYESFLRSLGRQGAIGGAMGEMQGVANTAQNAAEFGDPVEPERWARDIGNRWGIDPRTVQLTENLLGDAVGGVPGGMAGGALRRYQVGVAEPRLQSGGIELHEEEPEYVTPQGGVGREALTEPSLGALIFDRRGNAHIRLSDSKLLDNIDTATTRRADGRGYAVMHPPSGHVLAEGSTQEEAEARAGTEAARQGRRRLLAQFDSGTEASDVFHSVPSSSVGAVRRMIFEGVPYHSSVDNPIKSRGPVNGQDALDTSIQIKASSSRRVGIDYSTGEFVVFSYSRDNVYHGHVRSWNDLDSEMQNALKTAGMVNRRGKIARGNRNAQVP